MVLTEKEQSGILYWGCCHDRRCFTLDAFALWNGICFGCELPFRQSACGQTCWILSCPFRVVLSCYISWAYFLTDLFGVMCCYCRCCHTGHRPPGGENCCRRNCYSCHIGCGRCCAACQHSCCGGPPPVDGTDGVGGEGRIGGDGEEARRLYRRTCFYCCCSALPCCDESFYVTHSGASERSKNEPLRPHNLNWSCCWVQAMMFDENGGSVYHTGAPSNSIHPVRVLHHKLPIADPCQCAYVVCCMTVSYKPGSGKPVSLVPMCCAHRETCFYYEDSTVIGPLGLGIDADSDSDTRSVKSSHRQKFGRIYLVRRENRDALYRGQPGVKPAFVNKMGKYTHIALQSDWFD